MNQSVDSYLKLRDYISTMQMKHVYQPLMLRELLKSSGGASEQTIAKAIHQRLPALDNLTHGVLIR